MKRIETASLPRHLRTATVRSDTFSADDNTIDVIWTTGADVLRDDWLNGPYIERLSTDASAVRLDRLNNGASFLDTHNADQLCSVIGSVVKGSARMENGNGVCKVRLSQSDRAADTVQDIRDGIIANVSVGYAVYAFTRTEATDGSPAIMLATDWEPVEISAVPVPADPGANIVAATRSSAGLELNMCQITRSSEEPESISREAVVADNVKSDKDTKDVKNDKIEDKKVETGEAEQKDAHDIAAEKTGVAKEDIVKVDGVAVVTAHNVEITDPGDAHPTKITERQLAKMIDERVAAARTAERARNAEIMSLSRDYGVEDFGIKHCERGSSVQEVKDEILKSFKGRSFVNPIQSDSTPQVKTKDWSFARKHFGTEKK